MSDLQSLGKDQAKRSVGPFDAVLAKAMSQSLFSIADRSGFESARLNPALGTSILFHLEYVVGLAFFEVCLRSFGGRLGLETG